jgi:hypothetical protein
MNNEEILTVAAMGLAVAAVVYMSRVPGQNTQATTAQLQRDMALAKFNDMTVNQQISLTAGLGMYQNAMTGVMGLGGYPL